MKNKISNWTESEQFKLLGESYSGIMIGIMMVQLVLMIVAFLFKTPLFIFQTLVVGLIFILYLLFKEGASAGQKKIGAFVLKSSLLIYTLGFSGGLILSGIKKVDNPQMSKSMLTLLFIVGIGIIIGYIALLLNETVKEKFIELEETNVWEGLVGEKKEEIKVGDAVIGNKIEMSFKENGEKVFTETDLPVVLPIKDRYLHMLILGPTGSGKTSQIIIPMINRDIQNKDIGIIAMEPKGDLAEKVFAMARYYDREVQYFNPILPDCPYFNPLYGLEEDVVENMATTFKMLDNDSSQFFQNMNENLVRNAIKVLKRLYGDDATMLDLYTLVHNNESNGKKIIQEFSQIQVQTVELQKENDDIVAWFLGDYFTGSTGDSRNATKTYEHCSGIRSQIAKLVSNKYLRKVLNPPPGHGSDVDFDDALERGTVIAIATAQGKLRDLGRFLGYFLILQLQSSVFKRPGNENTRRGCMLYIDEFQVYSNPGFADMLTQGRSYRVASHLATQARDQIGMGGGKDGEAFIQLVSSNARNLVIFPGGNYKDADFYSKQFGEMMLGTTQKGFSQQKVGYGNVLEFRPKNESIRTTEALTSRFTASDLIYREFGEVTYLLIKKNSIQPPGISKLEYIPMELNETLDKMISEYNLIQDMKHQALFDEKMLAENPNKDESEEVLDSNTETSQFKSVYYREEAIKSIDAPPERKPSGNGIPVSNKIERSIPDGMENKYVAPTKSSVVLLDDEDEDELF